MLTTIYLISKTDNMGYRGTMAREFATRVQAKAYLDILLASPGYNIFNGKKVYRTSYRDALSGTGINNPRIIKRIVNRWGLNKWAKP